MQDKSEKFFMTFVILLIILALGIVGISLYKRGMQQNIQFENPPTEIAPPLPPQPQPIPPKKERWQFRLWPFINFENEVTK